MTEEAKKALREAIEAAIREIGLDAFKRTSMFALTNRRRAAAIKLAA